jgi:hypothetical protein
MKIQSITVIGCLIVGLLLAACSQTGSPPTPDVEAAVETAIAQTRTLETEVAQSTAAAVATNTSAAPANTPEPAPTNTPPPPADTPSGPPTDTPPAPTDTPPPAPAPTEEKLVIAESLVDGNDGNDFLRSSSPDNQGRVILLPGFNQSEVTKPMVFRDRMVFQVEVFDTRAGPVDGAGIQDVTFRIEVNDDSGQVVYEKREQNPGYCVFGGGEPDCAILSLENGSRWPDPYGGEIRNGEYLAKIDIIPEDGEPTQWRWRFNVEIPGQTTYPPNNTARINSIAVQDGRYVTEFETFGFEPLLPGQHVHFFFNSVSPEEAGVPGSGPWQIYPAGPGEPNTSPFTLYTVDQRPESATQMCILVANEDHSVNQGTGNCVNLP